MVEGNLSDREKAGLLGFDDSRKMDDYDMEFYELLWATKPPKPMEMDDRIRRAIVRFVTNAWDQHLQACSAQSLDEDTTGRSAMNIAFLKGYELGRKLQRPLDSNQEEPK